MKWERLDRQGSGAPTQDSTRTISRWSVIEFLISFGEFCSLSMYGMRFFDKEKDVFTKQIQRFRVVFSWWLYYIYYISWKLLQWYAQLALCMHFLKKTWSIGGQVEFKGWCPDTVERWYGELERTVALGTERPSFRFLPLVIFHCVTWRKKDVWLSWRILLFPENKKMIAATILWAI